MLVVEHPEQMLSFVTLPLGTSSWLSIDQEMISRFAAATGDHQWIHTDVERAAAEMPSGRTIAHGGLTLSLVPRLLQTIYVIERRARSINYGYDRVRFTSPVPAGSTVRLLVTLAAGRRVEGGVLLAHDCVLELQGSVRPALVARVLSIAYALH